MGLKFYSLSLRKNTSLGKDTFLCEKCHVLKRQIKEENTVSEMYVRDTKEQSVRNIISHLERFEMPEIFFIAFVRKGQKTE